MSANQPLVSILVPMYNAENFIGDAIRSALNQTHSNVEVVVVNDGSKDESLKRAQCFESDPRVTILDGPNKGACAARNRAFENSSGDYIQFLDADDMLHAEKLEKSLPYLVDGEFDFVFCAARLVFTDGRDPVPEKVEQPSPENLDPFEYLLRYNVGTNAPVHRRSIIEEAGLFREDLPRAQEKEFHLRIAACDIRMKRLSEMLVDVRIHDQERISSAKRYIGLMLNVLTGVSERLESKGQLSDPVRRKLLADAIMQSACFAFRDGEVAQAEEGFRVAFSLDSNASWRESRRWVRLLQGAIGVRRTEHVLGLARRVLRRR